MAASHTFYDREEKYTDWNAELWSYEIKEMIQKGPAFSFGAKFENFIPGKTHDLLIFECNKRDYADNKKLCLMRSVNNIRHGYIGTRCFIENTANPVTGQDADKFDTHFFERDKRTREIRYVGKLTWERNKVLRKDFEKSMKRVSKNKLVNDMCVKIQCHYINDSTAEVTLSVLDLHICSKIEEIIKIFRKIFKNEETWFSATQTLAIKREKPVPVRQTVAATAAPPKPAPAPAPVPEVKTEELPVRKEDTEQDLSDVHPSKRKGLTRAERRQLYAELVEKQLGQIVGLESVKKDLSAMKSRLMYEKSRQEYCGEDTNKAKNTVSCPNFIFAGNPGTGKTTLARIIRDMYVSYGILYEDCIVKEVSRKDLVGAYIGHSEEKTEKVLDELLAHGGGVLFVDEAYSLTQGGKDDTSDFGRVVLTMLLQAMENCRNSIIFIFAGYEKDMEEFIRINPGIESRITKVLHFDDYSEDELLMIAEKMAESNKYSISEEGKLAFKKLIAKERYSDRFGNARTVRKILEEAYNRKSEIYAAEGTTDMDTLTAEDFGVDVSQLFRKDKDELLDELNNLVGLDAAKSIIRTCINRAIYLNEEVNEGRLSPNDVSLSLNLAFIGSAGTGKTTVARIYAKLLHSIGLTKNDEFIEASRSDLVGMHQGETAQKVREVCERAYGGILFIDEAYSLVQGDSDNFGREALATLIKEMEDNRDKLTVILAGYTKEMTELINTNSGLKSRISEFVPFDDYNEEELMVIFKKFAKDTNLTISKEAEGKLRERINTMTATKDRNFGNARDVRQLFDKTRNNLMSRVVENGIKGDGRYIIRETDFS